MLVHRFRRWLNIKPAVGRRWFNVMGVGLGTAQPLLPIVGRLSCFRSSGRAITKAGRNVSDYAAASLTEADVFARIPLILVTGFPRPPPPPPARNSRQPWAAVDTSGEVVSTRETTWYRCQGVTAGRDVIKVIEVYFRWWGCLSDVWTSHNEIKAVYHSMNVPCFSCTPVASISAMCVVLSRYRFVPLVIHDELL